MLDAGARPDIPHNMHDYNLVTVLEWAKCYYGDVPAFMDVIRYMEVRGRACV